MTPVLAEFIGTAVMLLLGTGVCANVSLARTKGNGAGWIVVIVTWAMAVFTGVVIAGPYSGAHLNPSVTLAFAATGQFPWSDVPGYVLAQVIPVNSAVRISSLYGCLMYRIECRECQ